MDLSVGFEDERSAVVQHDDLVGAPFRDALSGAYERWLAELLPARPGYALVAVGGLARREMTQYSDLDLVLLHDGARADVAETADQIWYEVWDRKLRLDHSVRTVTEATEVATGDLKAMLGLLEARHLAGDPDLTRDLSDSVRHLWRSESARRLPELMAAQRERWGTSGEVAFRLEPQLKEGRGGLRDVQALRAVALSQTVDVPVHRLREPYRVLLDARGELHRVVGRAVDQLLLQDQDEVALRLGYQDAEQLARGISAAARTISYVCDGVQRSVADVVQARSPAAGSRILARPRRRAGLPVGAAGNRRPLADGVVEQAGEVVLARDADPASDPVLVLRAAAAAARHDLRLSPFTLERLTHSAALPEPWPQEARDALIAMLSAGTAAIRVVEDLDQVGLMVRLLPEWESVRFRPQRNPVHTFTVDRHLTETAAHAAGASHRVSRPDLLLVGAFLHDIGKGYPGDHTEQGMRVVSAVAPRLGFGPSDTATLVRMVEHHLLLPEVATRRDPDDPATIAGVVRAVRASGDLLELLSALTEADALATGPGAWSDWRASLVRALVRRTRAHLAGEPLPAVPGLTPRQQELAARGEVSVEVVGRDVTVVAPDQMGLLSRAAGVIALHRLDVHAAFTSTTKQHMAVITFTVSPRFGSPPDPALVRSDLVRVLRGDLALDEAIARRESAYPTKAPSGRVANPEPCALWVDGEATGAAVLEVRCTDSVGLLHRLAAALEDEGVDIAQARVSTLGTAAVDAFYVRDSSGNPISDAQRRQHISERVLAVVPR